MTNVTQMRPAVETDNGIITATGLATSWGILLIFMGWLYRTYDIAMSSPALEFSRQIGLPVLLFEFTVIFWCLANGAKLFADWQKNKNYVKILLISFLLTFSLSSFLFSRMPIFSVALDIGIVIQILFCIALCQSLNRISIHDVSSMVAVFMISMVIFCLMITEQFVVHKPPHEMISWQFAIPGFISVRLFGATCAAISSFIVISVLIDEETHRTRLWNYISVTFVTGLTIWTGTRVALLGIMIAVVVACGFYELRPRLMVWINVAISLFVATIVATALLPPDPSFYLLAPGDYSTPDTASGGRLGLWAATWHAFLTVPIFGAGAGSSHWMMPEGVFPHVQPHNVVLQFLLNWGTIGGLSGLILLAIAAWRAHEITKRNCDLLPVLAMLDCLLIMSFFEGIFHFAFQTMMVMICFGIIFRAGRTDG